MYIRRKVFSTFEDENGEERLFSTTEFMNEDQYLDELMYSDPEDEPKMKLLDKVTAWNRKHLMTKGERNLVVGLGKNDPEAWKKAGKREAIVNGALGSITGASLGYWKGGAKGAAIGGLAGAGVGAGLGYGSTRVGKAIRNHSIKESKNPTGKKFWKNNEKAFERNVDLTEVANGNMTKSEFAKKWNKKK
jgi:hypothetical protein